MSLPTLEQDGLIVRQRGLGTSGAPHKIRGEPMHLDSFVDRWAMQGRQVEAELLSMQEEDAAGPLGLHEDVGVVHVIRRADLYTCTVTVPLDPERAYTSAQEAE